MKQHNFKKYLFLFLLISQITSFTQNNLFETPDLYCVRNVTSTAIVLAWHKPNISPCFVSYDIYYKTDNSNFNLLLSVSNPNKLDTTINNPNPNQIGYFYMTQRGSCNNTNTIKQYSDTLDNRLSYPSVEIKNVSVVDNHIELKWNPNTYKEIKGYLIFSNKTVSNLFNTPIDTVFGSQNGTFIDTKVNVKDSQYTYKIRTLMTCDPDGAITLDNQAHTSAKLKITLIDKCSASASLQWDKYVYGNKNILNYEIQTKTSNTTFKTIDTVNNTTTSYTLKNLASQDSISVRLKINLPNTETAFSNVQTFFSETLTPIVKDYIRNITVNADSSVNVLYMKDTNTILNTPINLEASLKPSQFQNASQSSYSQNNISLFFEDKSTDPNKNSYYYRIEYRDGCNNIFYSDTVQTLHVSAVEKPNNIAKIDWEGFSIPSTNIVSYQLYKIINNVSSDTVLLKSYTSQNIHTENDNKLFDSKNLELENVCYFIVVNYYHLSDKPPRELLHSRSNIFCKVPTPKFFIPNAFVPEGYNKIIKPFILFATNKDYEFIVFNRWNEVVFKTNDLNDGWDGKYKGETAPFDSYTFVATYKGKDQNIYKEKGTFLLVR